MEKFFNRVKDFIRCEPFDEGIKIIAYLGMILKTCFVYYQHHQITVSALRAIYDCEKWSLLHSDCVAKYAMANVNTHFFISLFLFILLTIDFCTLASVETRKKGDVSPAIFFYVITFLFIFVYYLRKFIYYGIFDAYSLLFIIINGHFLLTLCSFFYKLRAEKLQAQPAEIVESV